MSANRGKGGAVATRTDSPIKEDVEEELRWEPMIDETQIRVSVHAGIVSLTGAVDTLGEKWAAQAATAGVTGVREVIQGLVIKVLTHPARSDAQIEAAAESALKWAVIAPHAVKAKVARGWITLEGEVTWNYEREAAERVVGHIEGVTGVSDAIVVRASAGRAIRSASK
jgi:osmotically-inducible protein OsmY